MKVAASRPAPGYTQKQLFQIAADIESYPNFLPLCQATRILERDGARMKVDNVFRLGPARVRFISQATFFAHERIEIVSTDGPFERLEITWRISLSEQNNCRVDFESDTRFKSRVFGKLAELFGAGTEESIVDAFIKEAARRFSRRE